ncbi:unnamed protein product [Peronospora belbahrii]|uniref:PX domain-containing protein n=1 Tax=Peronospora belbahrii TaxID=622444 RepID=A0AAU9LE29_9STRA|nr:unnamed protein product [Peronospora belbahrii]CAH0522356.1 unnamed protein product [Peronospora belbahrii]
MGCKQSKTEDVISTTLPKTETIAALIETEPVAASIETEPVTAPIETEPVTAEEVNVTEPVVIKEPVPVVEESVEPKAEVTTSEEPVRKQLAYKITGHEINEVGVVFYTVEAVKGDISFKKRFNEFKALVTELGNPKHLPSLPDSGLGVKLRGKHNAVVIKTRETQLAVVLNAIANDMELIEKPAFKEFAQ